METIFRLLEVKFLVMTLLTCHSCERMMKYAALVWHFGVDGLFGLTPTNTAIRFVVYMIFANVECCVILLCVMSKISQTLFMYPLFLMVILNILQSTLPA